MTLGEVQVSFEFQQIPPMVNCTGKQTADAIPSKPACTSGEFIRRRYSNLDLSRKFESCWVILTKFHLDDIFVDLDFILRMN